MKTEPNDLTNATPKTPKCTERLMFTGDDKMILTKKEEKLGKSEAVYQLLLSMNKKYTEYLLNIFDMKNQDDLLSLAGIKEILFFEDAIVILSKNDGASFINLNHVLSIELIPKRGY